VRQNDTKKRENAAHLIADDCLSDEKIAEQVQISRSTLARWKSEPRFITRVEAIATAYAKRVLNRGIARKERRVAVLNELHEKMLLVISERAESADLSTVPGGKTGLITKMLKGIGKGEDFQVVEVYEVDTGTVKEIRALQEQVAEELGQRVERTETVDLNKLFEKMTPAELESYASKGTLPSWFPAQRQQEGTQYVS
jgi:Helix-turn-helix of insertion element transposase